MVVCEWVIHLVSPVWVTSLFAVDLRFFRPFSSSDCCSARSKPSCLFGLWFLKMWKWPAVIEPWLQDSVHRPWTGESVVFVFVSWITTSLHPAVDITTQHDTNQKRLKHYILEKAPTSVFFLHRMRSCAEPRLEETGRCFQEPIGKVR